MPSDWYDRLRAALDADGFEHHELVAGDARLLVTTQAARLLGCVMPGLGRTAFWHNPALETAGRAAKFMGRGGGGLGGDRLWIAPEVGFIFDDLEKARVAPLKHEALPPAMDPGQWTRHGDAGEDHAIHLHAAMRLTDFRTGKSVALEVERACRLIGPPAGLPTGVSHLGFALRHTLVVTGGDAGAAAGAWSLLQVPPAGTLHCPTTTPIDDPRSYYDPYGDVHVQSGPHGVRFLIDGTRRTKMGLLAEHTTGRMAYFRPSTPGPGGDGDAALGVLRVFAPRPGEPYVDLPRDSDAFLGGDCLQAYNHLEGIGKFPPFGEMEYHDPALIVGEGPTRRVGDCVTHVFTGDDAAVRAALGPLLGMPIDPITAPGD